MPCFQFILLKEWLTQKWSFASPLGHPRCRRVCLFIRTDFEKFSITSLENTWCYGQMTHILAGSNNLKFMKASNKFACYSYSLFKTLIESCGLLVDYCDVFISCLGSHSDGTHSLQRIHWWANDVMLNAKICSDEETIYILHGLWVSSFLGKLLLKLLSQRAFQE